MPNPTLELTLVAFLSGVFAITVVAKDCGPVLPGTSMDKNCKRTAFPPPLNEQGDAAVVGEVNEIRCGYKGPSFQEYKAIIDIRKTLRGAAESPLEIRFKRYSDSQVRFGESGISFTKGDIVELILTHYKDYWSVQFPFHKKVLKAGAGTLPKCETDSPSRR